MQNYLKPQQTKMVIFAFSQVFLSCLFVDAGISNVAIRGGKLIIFIKNSKESAKFMAFVAKVNAKYNINLLSEKGVEVVRATQNGVRAATDTVTVGSRLAVESGMKAGKNILKSETFRAAAANGLANAGVNAGYNYWIKDKTPNMKEVAQDFAIGAFAGGASSKANRTLTGITAEMAIYGGGNGAKDIMNGEEVNYQNMGAGAAGAGLGGGAGKALNKLSKGRNGSYFSEIFGAAATATTTSDGINTISDTIIKDKSKK